MNITFATLPGVCAFAVRAHRRFVTQRRIVSAAEKQAHIPNLRADWHVNPDNGRLEMHCHADNEPPAETLSQVEKLGMVLAVYQSGRAI